MTHLSDFFPTIFYAIACLGFYVAGYSRGARKTIEAIEKRRAEFFKSLLDKSIKDGTKANH